MKDLFDQLLDSQVSIWKKGGSGIFDGYGIESQILILLVQGVPCAIQPGEGKEVVSDAGFGTQKYMFFMRPQLVDVPAITLNIHHWLQINNLHGVAQGATDPNGTVFDVRNVKNVYGHHLEVEALVIEP